MGTIQHDVAIAVASFAHDKANAAFAEVKYYAAKVGMMDEPIVTDFASLLIGPVEGVANFTTSYVMLPDGSKEWWPTSDLGNDIRNLFVEKMSEAGCQVAHVSFGELGSSFNLHDPR